MKQMFLALLAMAAATVSAFSTDFTLNSTEVCYDGVFNHTLLETNTSGWAYNATGCSIAPSSFVNISGAALPILYVGVSPVPVGMVFNGGSVGAGSALVVHGPVSNKARATVPWLVDIIGNTFGENAQLRVIGSIPINSTITISSNTFDVRQSNSFLTDTLSEIMAISVGGQLTEVNEPVSLYPNCALNITSNQISVNGATADKAAAGIAILTDMYFTNATSLRINDNTVNAVCGLNKECIGLTSTTDGFLTMVDDYFDARVNIDRNSFTVKNGRGFTLPQVWSPNTTFYVSASHNSLSLDNSEAASAVNILEHAISVFQIAAGRSTVVEILFNTVTSIGNRMIFFGAAVDFAEDSVFNCSWNDIFTTAGDPGVYVLDQLSIVDRAIFAIDSNRFQRQDNTAVSRPYLSLTFDFSVLGTAELSFRENECYPSNIATGPLMVVLTSGRVANMAPTAYLAICGNIYNGNPADLLVNTVVTENIRSFINCVPRTTLAPETTEAPTEDPANTTTVATITTSDPTDNSASHSGSALLAAAAALAAALVAAML